MRQQAEPLYPSLPVCFVAIPFIWNFYTLICGTIVYDLTRWADSLIFAYALIGSTAFLAVIFYLPSRRHYPVEVFFSARRIALGALGSVLLSAIGVVLALAAARALALWLSAACGFDLRSPSGDDDGPEWAWANWLLVGLIFPFTDELLMRVIALRGLLQYYPPWTALGLSASLYTIARWFLMPLVPLFIFGIFLGCLFLRTRSLWAVFLGSSVAYLLEKLFAVLNWSHGLESRLVELGLSGPVILPLMSLLLLATVGAGLGYVGWWEVCRHFPKPAAPETESA